MANRCSATSCPLAFTDESEVIQNYGCLPSPAEILDMRVKSGKTWACHSNHKKPCLGGLLFIRDKGYDFKVVDSKLVTEMDDWREFVDNER